jgi:hypothetical protein
MPRNRRGVPWLEQPRQSYSFYVCWYNSKRQRTERISLRTPNRLEAQKRFAAFLTEGHAIMSPDGCIAEQLTVARALEDYIREHVAEKVVDRQRQADAARHLVAYFGSSPIANVDIPASRAYAKWRREGHRGLARADDEDYRSAYAVSWLTRAKKTLKTLDAERQQVGKDIDRAIQEGRTEDLEELRIQKRRRRHAIAKLARKMKTPQAPKRSGRKGHSDSTIRRELVTLKAAARHAANWKRIGPNAMPPTGMPSIAAVGSAHRKGEVADESRTCSDPR